jgi:hypothetical protein
LEGSFWSQSVLSAYQRTGLVLVTRCWRLVLPFKYRLKSSILQLHTSLNDFDRPRVRASVRVRRPGAETASLTYTPPDILLCKRNSFQRGTPAVDSLCVTLAQSDSNNITLSACRLIKTSCKLLEGQSTFCCAHPAAATYRFR